MLIVHVDVLVKAEYADRFEAASLENARNSIQEPGIIRFDVTRHQDDPAHFMLIEIYRDENAPAKHKETAHYQKWRDTVADMMARPRSSVKFAPCFPEAAQWEYPGA